VIEGRQFDVGNEREDLPSAINGVAPGGPVVE